MAKFIRTEEGDLVDPGEIMGVFMNPFFRSTDGRGNVLAESPHTRAMIRLFDGSEYYLDDEMTFDQAVAFVEEAQS